MNLVSRVDEYFIKNKVTFPYPAVVIESQSVEPLGLITDCLVEGDVSVVFEHKGDMFVLKKKISRSVLELSKLLSVYYFTLVLDKDRAVTVRKIEDILELGNWTQY